MKNMQRKLPRTCMNKWRKLGSRVMPCAAGSYDYCKQQWGRLWSSTMLQADESSIPKDVPKGHLVVYVGENCKRYVINITLLKHPLFKALLDQARDELYDFSTADSKLCIPCDESIFLDVVRCAGSPVLDPRTTCLRL